MKQLTLLIAIFASIVLAAPSFAQENKGLGNLKGTVSTQDGQYAGHINISLKGSGIGTVTNVNGEFEINGIKEGSYSLMISLIGMTSKQIPVTITKNETTEIPPITLTIDSKELNEVVVYGEKANVFARKETDFVARLPLKNLENPQVYQVITKELMQEQITTDMQGALKNAAGMSHITIGPGGGGASVSGTLRGFNSGYTSTRNGLSSGSVRLADPVNVERVEVIKGPSGTLFGSALVSYGGLVNLVTKQPFETVKGELSYTGGQWDLNRITADINAPLNAEKTALFRVNAAFHNEKSFQDFGKQQNIALAPSFLFKLSPRLTVQLDAEYYQSTRPLVIYDASYLSSEQVKSFNDLKIDRKKSYVNNDLDSRLRTTSVFARANYKISDQWVSQTSYSAGKGDNSTNYFFIEFYGDSTNRNSYSVPNGDLNTLQIQQNFIGDFRIGSARNRLVAGLDYMRFSSSSQRQWAGVDAVGTFDASFPVMSRAKIDGILAQGTYRAYAFVDDTYSAYASDVLSFNDRLIAMASLRVDRYTSDGSGQTALSPKLGLVYQLVKNQVSVFANYMNGFQNQSGEDFAGNKFKPQQANQLEGGIKVETRDRKLNASLSYYDISVTNVLRRDVAHTDFSIQDGTQRSKGFEVDIIANPAPGLNAVAGYGYNDITYTKADAGLEGNRPAGTPKHTGNIWLSYKQVKKTARGLGVGLGLNFNSDSFINESNTITLDGYTTLAASLFYDQPKYRLGLKANNLTNTNGWNVSYYYTVPVTPRQIVVSLTLKF